MARFLGPAYLRNPFSGPITDALQNGQHELGDDAGWSSTNAGSVIAMADDRPVLNQINLVVRDMDAMIEFYRKLGVEIAPTEPPWDRHHRTLSMPDGLDFDLDSTDFAAQWNRGWPPGQTGPVVGFRVASREAVDRIYEELTNAGYVGQQPPYDAFWGARYAVIADPEGNSVGVMSPVDPARRTPSPTPPTE